MKKNLDSFYRKLYKHFGPQHWWPAKSSFEVMVGAILTQSTNWSNVEKAISDLRENKLLHPRKLYALSEKKLAVFIRPAGYYNIKAKRLKAFLKFLFNKYQGSMEKISRRDTRELREELLSVNGVGEETADSILLYALNKPVFVVDAYTKRIFSRHRLIDEKADYHTIQKLFMRNLKNSSKMFNEYHALLVKTGKDYCRKSKPLCVSCPLGAMRHCEAPKEQVYNDKKRSFS